MRYAALFLVLALLTTTTRTPLSAQRDDSLPLLVSAVRDDQFIVQQDLYVYQDNAWQAVTSGGYKGGFALSPDARHMAYLVAPDVVRQAVEAGQDYLLASVWDIALLDLTTGETRVVAAQPDDVTLSADGRIAHGVDRSLPIWSPDGDALAWTEQDYPAGNNARLVVADLPTGQTRILDAALPQMTMSENGLPSFLAWSKPGIVVFTNDPTDNAETLRFYDPAHGLTRSVVMPDDGEDWIPVSGPLWVEDGDREVVVVQAGDVLWYRVDAGSGEVGGFAQRLERVSVSQPDTALHFVWEIFAGAGEPAWQLVGPDEAVLMGWPKEERRPGAAAYVLSGSGEAAYLQDRQLFRWRDGSAEQLALPNALTPVQIFWSPTRWRAGAAYDGLG